MSPRARSWLRRLTYFAIYYLLASAVFGVILAETTLRPPRLSTDRISAFTANEISVSSSSFWRDVFINSPLDTQTLRAWLIRPTDPKRDNGSAVILLHGLGDSRAGTSAFAPFLLRAGYTVLVPDSRAHGLSSGELATYGLRESADLRAWIDFLKSPDPLQPDAPPANCVFAIGESMGASILLQTLPDEPRFCAVAAESGFATFREIGYDRLGQILRLGPANAHILGRTLLRPTLELGLLYTKLRYKLSLGAVSPADALAASSTPVLLIHGDADRNIPPRHASILLSRSRSANRTPPIEFWSVPNADHTSAYITSQLEFESRILAFFSDHTPTPAPTPTSGGSTQQK